MMRACVHIVALAAVLAACRANPGFQLRGDGEELVSKAGVHGAVVAREGRASEGARGRGHAASADAESPGVAVAAVDVREASQHLAELRLAHVVLVLAADGEGLEGDGLHVAAVAVVLRLPGDGLAGDGFHGCAGAAGQAAVDRVQVGVRQVALTDGDQMSGLSEIRLQVGGGRPVGVGDREREVGAGDRQAVDLDHVVRRRQWHLVDRLLVVHVGADDDRVGLPAGGGVEHHVPLPGAGQGDVPRAVGTHRP